LSSGFLQKSFKKVSVKLHEKLKISNFETGFNESYIGSKRQIKKIKGSEQKKCY